MIFIEAIEAARQLGAEHGKSLASWFETNEWAVVLSEVEDGDPAVWDAYSSPLSGEYADGLTPQRLMEQLGYNGDAFTVDAGEEESLVCHAYEGAHAEAWIAEIERMARNHLSD